MMRSGVAVVLLPPCHLGLGRIRQAQFKDTQFQAQFKAFEALTLYVTFVLSFVYLSFSLSLTVLRHQFLLLFADSPGLNLVLEFFPNEINKVNIAASDHSLQQLKHRKSWTIISCSLPYQTLVNHGQECSPGLVQIIDFKCRDSPDCLRTSRLIDEFDNLFLRSR
ncbi:hypothetical protein Tco_0084845 [Tanacetum coccineum]